jgi:hypothetical protein
MLIKTPSSEVNVPNATVTMDGGEHLSVACNVKGVYQIIHIHVQGHVVMVQHEGSQDAVLFKPSGNQFVKA